MSQAKVDRYKEDKKNREKIMKKQKLEWTLTKAGLGVFAVILVGWVAIAGVQRATQPNNTVTEVTNYSVDTSSLDEYLNNLSAE